MRDHQQRLVDELLPRLSVPAEGPVTAGRVFGRDQPMHLEIGMGSGEHLLARADLLPDHGFIGAEPYLNGVAAALSDLAEQRLANVRLHHGDALDVLERVPDGTLRFVTLLHPDPWPKARHAKRRMVNDGPVALIADKLEAGGEFRFQTDDPTYLTHALSVLRRHRDRLEWLVEGPADWQRRPGGWPGTRYEAKARRHGHEVWYFRYRRR